MTDTSLLKVLMVGEVKTGKTSMLTEALQTSTMKQYTPTIGIDFSVKQLIVNDKVVKLQLWDSSGDDKYQSILGTYCRGLHGVIIVYDITDEKTFDKIQKWFNLTKKHCPQEVQYFLVGNKADLSERKVTKQQGEEFAKLNNMEFHEISALDSNKMKEFFMSITFSLLTRQKDEEHLRRRAQAQPPTKKSSTCSLL